MTDDIVTRLRLEYASCECSGINHDCDRCETDQEAADEIERLNEQTRLLRYSLEHQVCECSHCLGEEGAT
jgi:hypothetical protein